MEYTRRKIEDLNLMDDFLFYEAVSGEKGQWFCRLLIRTMCRKEVKDIQIQPQNIIQGVDIARHGIRMDLYVDAAGICLYDFEPDQYTDCRVLPKRSRYYRALSDGRLLNAGEDYDKMPDMWTVFILTHDPFGRDRVCYTVRNKIIEEPDIQYEDGAVTLFLYTKGHQGGSEELSSLLNYMEHSTEENATTEELKNLHDYVTMIKHKKEVGVRYMKSWEIEKMLHDKGLAEGREEGKAEGKVEGYAESIIGLLNETGDVSEKLRTKIFAETDLEILKKWLLLAARVTEVSAFEEGM